MHLSLSPSGCPRPLPVMGPGRDEPGPDTTAADVLAPGALEPGHSGGTAPDSPPARAAHRCSSAAVEAQHRTRLPPATLLPAFARGMPVDPGWVAGANRHTARKEALHVCASVRESAGSGGSDGRGGEDVLGDPVPAPALHHSPPNRGGHRRSVR